MIKTTSFSRMSDFEKCKYLARLKYVDRIPEPLRPFPPGKTEHANERGTRVHDGAELYIRGGVELIKELEKFAAEFAELRRLYMLGKVTLEGEWAVDRDWQPVAWGSADAWNRMKLDAFVHETPNDVRIIDFKTGKKYGNEVKHTEQGQIYQLAVFLRFPEVHYAEVEFWYIDHGETEVKRYTREQGTAYFGKYDKRLAAVTECTDFKPNPNAFSCRWCPYNGNACVFGISPSIKAARNYPPRQTA